MLFGLLQKNISKFAAQNFPVSFNIKGKASRVNREDNDFCLLLFADSERFFAFCNIIFSYGDCFKIIYSVSCIYRQ